MFDFLFKYPPTVFAKGEFVLLSRWPVWLLLAAIVASAGALGWVVWRRKENRAPGLEGRRLVAIWLLQSCLAGLVLILLWRPAISVATLKQQQNIVAVLVDDSHSMSIREEGKTRLAQAVDVLNGGVLSGLRKKFQVRIYRFGPSAERIQNLQQLGGASEATRIGDALKQIAAEGTSLPIGAVVLLSDGADNSGGIGLETISEIRRRRIPVHTIGFGREQFSRDLEVSDVVLPSRTLADSRLSAQVTFRQHGYTDREARVVVSEGGKILASQRVKLKFDGAPQTESVPFNAGVAGAKSLLISVDSLEGEENPNNNAVTRLVNVQASRPRILYLEGEPRWELKFIRRAIDEDRSLQLTSILRTTQNKIYVQGVENPKELEEGFPSKAETLFSFQGVVLGNVEASYFTPAQQELIREFVDRRGGGLLFLGGRAALADGGYAKSSFTDLLPVTLPERKGTFFRDRASVELTAAGRESLMCRLEEDPEKNVLRWKKLPELADYQEVGSPKPAALVLAELVAGGKTLPLLVTENYGRGRTALFATGGSWRWKMLQDHADKTHQMFWQQLLRWLVAESPNPVAVSTPHQVLSDEPHVQLRAEVRDKTFLPVPDARVEARILGPGGLSDTSELTPNPVEPGVYAGEWLAEKPGSYLVEVSAKRGSEEIGRDVLTFRREDGVAENFGAEQNRELLEKLAEQTGGRYYRPEDAAKLGEEISYSEAGITTREMRDLWDMPFVFLLLILMCAGEWLLRRKCGVI